MPYDMTQMAEYADKVELVRAMLEELTDDVGRFCDVYHVGDLEQVECESRDGFIGFTNGGFEAIAYADFSSARGSGCIPNAIEEMLNSTLAGAARYWLEERAEVYGYVPDEGDERDPEQIAWDFLNDLEEADAENTENLLPMPLPRHGLPKCELARQDYYETEDAHLSEGTTYFYKLRALFYAPDNHHGSGEPEVYIMAAINTDLEYGRDSIRWAGGDQNVGGYEETIPLAEVTPEKMQEVLGKCLAALEES